MHTQFRHQKVFKVIAATTLAALLALGGCGTDLSDVEHLKRAKEFQEKSDTRSSLIELKNALQKNPDNMEARWLLGQIYVNMGDGVGAEKDLRRTLELGMSLEKVIAPLAKALLLQGKHEEVLELTQQASQLPDESRAQIYALRGEVFLNQDNLKDAKTEFQAALDSKPDSASARFGQALVAVRLGQLDSARAWIEKALEVAPYSADVWSLRGDVENLAANFDAAEEAYTKAIEYRLDNWNDTYKRTLVRIEQQKYETAQKDIDTLRRLEPLRPGSDYAQGLIHFRREELEPAQTAFETALKKNENFLLAQFYLGATHFARDNLRQAETYLNHFLTFVPQSERAAKLLTQVRIRNRDLLGAEIALRPLLEQHPDDPEVVNLAAQLRQAQGNDRASIENLRKIVGQQPDAAETQLLLGLKLLQEGEAEKGAAALKTAMQLDSGISEAGRLLFYNHLRTREFDKALTVALDLAEKLPENPEAYNLIGVAYRAKEDPDKARSAFDKALSLEANFNHARMNLAAMDMEAGDLQAAEIRFQQILEYDSKHIDALLGLARLAEQNGRIDQNLAWLQKAWAYHPGSPQVGLALIDAYLKLQNTPKAVNLARDLHTRDPDDPAVVRALALALLADGQLDGALTNLLKLTRLQPSSPEGWHLTAVARSRLGDYAGALEALNTALAAKEDYLPSLVARTEALLQLGRFSDALDGALSLQGHYRQQGIGYKLEGDYHRLRKSYPYAIQAYRTALQKNPDTDTLLRLAETLRLAGQDQDALETLRAWLATHPDDNPVRTQLGIYLQQTGQSGEAVAEYQRLPEQQRTDAMTLASVVEQKRILSLLEEGKFDEAIAAAAELGNKQPDSPAPLSLQGIALMRKGDADGARAAFTEALARVPGDPSASLNLAQLALAENDLETPRDLYQNVLKHRPGHLQTLLALARLELRQNQPEQAKAWWEQAIQHHPSATLPRVLLGGYYLRAGQPRRTMQIAYDAGASGADNPELLTMLGEAQLQEKQFANAIATFEQIVSLKPAAAQPRYLLAKAYGAGQMPKLARSELEQALRLDPYHLPANIALTRQLTMDGNIESARSLLEVQKQLHPNHPEILAQDGWLALQENHPQDAADALEASLRLQPNNQVAANLALAKWRTGDRQQSLEVLESWLETHPDDVFIQLHLSNLYLSAEQPDKARAVYGEIVADYPENVIALNNLAALLRKENPEKAKEYAQRAFDLSPGTPAIMDTLGMILLEQGEIQRALRLFEATVDAAPEGLTYRYHLALALAQAGDRTKARETLQDALNQDKAFAEVQEARALLRSLAGKDALD